MQWKLTRTAGNELTFEAAVAAGTSYDESVTTTSSGIAANVWQQITVERVSGTLKIYVNTTERGSGTIGTIQDGTGSLYIGINQAGTEDFSGLIEEIASSLVAEYSGTVTEQTAPFTLTRPNITFVSDSFTATTAPTSGDAYVLIEEVDTITLNTDLTVELTRDGGTTWTLGTLADTGYTLYDSTNDKTYEIWKAEDIDISAQPSGTSVALRVVTANNPDFYFKGWLFQWA